MIHEKSDSRVRRPHQNNLLSQVESQLQNQMEITSMNFTKSFNQLLVVIVAFSGSFAAAQDASETLPALKNGQPPKNLTELWQGFDPRAEPLEVETLREWEEDEVVLRIVRFRIGVFKGKTAKLAAVFGFPKNVKQGEKIPGLLQIHGGGQYADYKACLANAKRGYATLSIAWAGRISAPGYRVSPAEVKLFWDGKTDDPAYRVTTEWGAVDGYHAPGRNAGSQFPSAKAAEWTLDRVESPRNSGWFLCALAARRALTFLERQPQVDADRLGVYGHSMGGKLTVMTSVDSRVKAAAPSCGGISDLYNSSDVFGAAIHDDHSLREIKCPIIFLSPANDFHGRISDLPAAVDTVSGDWRVTCSPHHNHQDTAPYEVATLLWFDQHLKSSFVLPKTPQATLVTDGGLQFSLRPDASKKILSVDVYYTQHGKTPELPSDGENTKSRFWHHAAATQTVGHWSAELPISSTDKPLWVYANVRYALEQPVSGVGYYYGAYTADSFNVSSLVKMVTADELGSAKLKATVKPSLLIEDFAGDWEKEWFTYRPAEWPRTTCKLRDAKWKAPADARLAIEVQSAEANTLVVMLDKMVAEVPLAGGDDWQPIVLSPADFHDVSGKPRSDWNNILQLKLSATERLRPQRGTDQKPKVVGAKWKGADPKFRNLRWDLTSED